MKQTLLEGDSFEVLNVLERSYADAIDIIYTDPPYNTKGDFIYFDKHNDGVETYKDYTEQKNERGNGKSTKTETSGASHSNWLSMMYPRLEYARRLLSDDGVIFISINDYELGNLQKLCMNIFGESNKLSTFCWRTDGNFDNQARIKVCHEYILLYAKNEQSVLPPNTIDPNISMNSKLYNDEIRNTIIKNGSKNPISEVVIPKGFPSSEKTCVINANSLNWPKYNSDIYIDNFKTQNDVIAKTGWASKDLLLEYINNNYMPIQDSKGQITNFVITRTGAIEAIKKRKNTSHVISVITNMGGTQKASSDMEELGGYFDYPKPVQLIRYLVSMFTKDGDVILDFFAGSGTTAHSMIDLNIDNNENRKYILVQIPEPCDPKTSSGKAAIEAGFKNIAEIGKERIRWAGATIKKEHPNTKIDIGFKVFKLDSKLSDKPFRL